MSILGFMIGFCYGMLYLTEMGEQFLVCGLCGLMGLVIDLLICHIDGCIQRKKVMKRIRKNRK